MWMYFYNLEKDNNNFWDIFKFWEGLYQNKPSQGTKEKKTPVRLKKKKKKKKKKKDSIFLDKKKMVFLKSPPPLVLL